MNSETMVAYRGQRLLDLVVAITALIVLSPIMVIVAILVRLTIGAPVLFRQLRPGFRGKPFELIKFRTMLDTVDKQGKPLPDKERIIPLGRFLRSTSLDELPELYNVIFGQMSIVGPRPLLMQYLNRYTNEQSKRHDVRPGITGWAQINGRNAISWEEKFDLDIWYVKNSSFAFDIKIIAMTLWKMVAREGISHPGHVTMMEFMGTERNTEKPQNSPS